MLASSVWEGICLQKTERLWGGGLGVRTYHPTNNCIVHFVRDCYHATKSWNHASRYGGLFVVLVIDLTVTLSVASRQRPILWLHRAACHQELLDSGKTFSRFGLKSNNILTLLGAGRTTRGIIVYELFRRHSSSKPKL